MRIAIFTNNYLPNPYGVSTSIETFRRDFEKLGHQVFIFAPRWPGYIDENPNVFRYPSWDIEFKFRFPLAIPYSWKISKILKNLDLDIIHAQHPNLLGSAAMKWARKKKIPLVFTWHTLYDRYTNFVPLIPPKISAGFMIKKAVKFANKSDIVVVPTDSIIPILRKWGVKKEMIPIASGVVETDFSGADRNKIRKKYNIADDKTLLVMVSRLTDEKNVEFVFDVVADILKKDKVKFLVVGDGYLLSKLQKFCADNKIQNKVIFAGVIDREEIKNYFAAGDIFVYGSKSETQGMIMTEAMYSGLPVVAVDATGTSSLIKNNVNGFLVKEDLPCEMPLRGSDEAAISQGKNFSDAVEKLVADANLRQKFSETSKKIARENFTSEICAKKMLEIYKKLINKK